MVCVIGSVIGSVSGCIVGILVRGYRDDDALAVDDLLLCFTNADCHNGRSCPNLQQHISYTYCMLHC